MTWRERWAELKRIYNGEKREIRGTAVGWQPDAGYQEDTCPTPSGEREFYRVVSKPREKKKNEQKPKH